MAVNEKYKSRPTRALKADVWIARATERWRGRFIYDRVEEQWVNASTKVEVKCPEHGYFSIRPTDHVARTTPGCKKCSAPARAAYGQGFLINPDRKRG